MTGIGFYQLGDWIPLCIQPHNGTYAPTLPDASPTAKIVDSTGTLVETINLPIVDRYGAATALFMHRRFLDATYSVGKYMIFYAWATGSGAYAGSEVQQFEIVAGGNVFGSHFGMYWNETPSAGYVISAMDGGYLFHNRNPH